MINNYECRACGSQNTFNLGLLPKQTSFAGKLLRQSLPESYLFECGNCYLLARHPILSTSQYNELYEQASSQVWSSSNTTLRHDQLVVRNFILKQNKHNIKVLDVGCYTAELLTSLPESYLRFGIEMSQEATSVAIKKGTKIIGNDLYNIVTNEKFDVITAVDVIEHTDNPEIFIKKLITVLKVDGVLIISTGNTSNWLWKLLKARFWYSRFPEHISFIGENWVDRFCNDNGFLVVDKQLFSYAPVVDFFSFLKSMTKFILMAMQFKVENFSNTTKDHFCFVIKKI